MTMTELLMMLTETRDQLAFLNSIEPLASTNLVLDHLDKTIRALRSHLSPSVV